MRFWDSSAVAALCLEEERTAEMDRLASDDPFVAVWWATPVECASAIARRRRDGALPAEVEAAALEILDHLSERWFEIQAGELVRSHAYRLLRGHALRAADALQLAAALVWAGSPGPRPSSTVDLVTLDRRLAEAARLEGLRVLPEDI